MELASNDAVPIAVSLRPPPPSTTLNWLGFRFISLSILNCKLSVVSAVILALPIALPDIWATIKAKDIPINTTSTLTKIIIFYAYRLILFVPFLSTPYF